MVVDQHGVQCGQLELADHSLSGWLPHGPSGVVVQVRVLAGIDQPLEEEWHALNNRDMDRWS